MINAVIKEEQEEKIPLGRPHFGWGKTVRSEKSKH
jgi:hypothetical protein